MAKILICSGIFPPQVGGPAQYAKEVAQEFKARGFEVKVRTYGFERRLPPIVRHKLFFWRVILAAPGVDFILALDTFSVGWPASWAAKILGKKILIRTGGDFLWESYIERTGDLVLLRNFYKEKLERLNWKERLIFKITKRTLRRTNALIFSTDWQRRIFEHAYGLDSAKNFIVENFYGPKLLELPELSGVQGNQTITNRVFVAGTRPLKWKNIARLKQAFEMAKMVEPAIELDLANAPYENFLQKIQAAYAVILVSLGDISPNMILDALRANTPFILTRETGLYDRLRDVAIFADPEDPQDIKEKILFLADDKNREIQRGKIANFNFVHSWQDIVSEILAIAAKPAISVK